MIGVTFSSLLWPEEKIDGSWKVKGSAPTKIMRERQVEIENQSHISIMIHQPRIKIDNVDRCTWAHNLQSSASLNIVDLSKDFIAATNIDLR